MISGVGDGVGFSDGEDVGEAVVGADVGEGVRRRRSRLRRLFRLFRLLCLLFRLPFRLPSVRLFRQRCLSTGDRCQDMASFWVWVRVLVQVSDPS
jgi:hypothetical protein